MDISKVKTSRKKSEEGVWLECNIEDNEGNLHTIQVKVARHGNAKYQQYLAKLSQPHRRAVASGTLNSDINMKLVQKAEAHCILVDWKGLTDGEKEFPYSPENSEALLKSLPELRDFIRVVAQDMKLFREEVEEIESGNSQKPSDGTLNGENL